MKMQAVRVSYRIYDEDLFINLLNEQTEVVVCLNAAYTVDHRLVECDIYEEDDPLVALEAARHRAHISRGVPQAKPKTRSSIIIGEGEGRRSREFEVQWWPNLYKSSFGKLSLRFFVNKTYL